MVTFKKTKLFFLIIVILFSGFFCIKVSAEEKVIDNSLDMKIDRLEQDGSQKNDKDGKDEKKAEGIDKKIFNEKEQQKTNKKLSSEKKELDEKNKKIFTQSKKQNLFTINTDKLFDKRTADHEVSEKNEQQDKKLILTDPYMIFILISSSIVLLLGMLLSYLRYKKGD